MWLHSDDDHHHYHYHYYDHYHHHYDYCDDNDACPQKVAALCKIYFKIISSKKIVHIQLQIQTTNAISSTEPEESEWCPYSQVNTGNAQMTPLHDRQDRII